MQLQIEFPRPGGQFTGERTHPLECIPRLARRPFWTAFQIPHAQPAFDQIFLRAAAAIAHAEQADEFVAAIILVKPFLRLNQRIRIDHRVIIVFREEVGHHRRAIHAAPIKEMKREGVELVPGNLLRHEKVHAAFPEDLRHRRGIAEDIRKPEIAHVLAELIPEKIFAVDKLTHHRFATDNVAVRLHPHAALKLPAPRLDGGLYFFIERGIALFHKLIVLGL